MDMLKQAWRYHLGLVLLGSAVFGLLRHDLGLGFLIGGAIGSINLYGLARITAGMTRPEGVSGVHLIWFLGKSTVVFGLLALAIKFATIEPVGLIAGLACIPVSLGAAGWNYTRTNKNDQALEA